MHYAKVYVDVYTHPKFIQAGFEASGYWMHSLAYLRHHESSDGFLADEVITVPLAGKRAQCRKLCERLVLAGLFRKVEGGYALLRYAEKNETKADILLAKTAARERKERHQERVSAHSKPSLDPLPASSEAPMAPDPDVIGTRSASATVTRSPRAEEEDAERVPPSISLALVCACDSFCACGRGGDRALTQTESGRAQGPPARRPLPPSERGMWGHFWLTAFTEGITHQTGRPCSAGRMYVTTLERIVEDHAPARDAPRASAWIREQAAAFAAKWDGHHPAKGLTPDGLERWLNDGRVGPPKFGNQAIVQLPASEWKPDDFSDLGATVMRVEGARKVEPHES